MLRYVIAILKFLKKVEVEYSTFLGIPILKNSAGGGGGSKSKVKVWRWSGGSKSKVDVWSGVEVASPKWRCGG